MKPLILLTGHSIYLEKLEQRATIGSNHLKQHIKLLPLCGFTVGRAEGKR